MVVDWSDAARYAYASLFALSLNERYSESCDAQFRQQSLHHLLEHVKLMRVNTCHLFVCTIWIDIIFFFFKWAHFVVWADDAIAYGIRVGPH